MLFSFSALHLKVKTIMSIVILTTLMGTSDLKIGLLLQTCVNWPVKCLFHWLLVVKLLLNGNIQTELAACDGGSSQAASSV